MVHLNAFDHWVLTGMIFAPGVGAAILMLIPATQEKAIKSFALFASLVAFGLGVYVFAHFNLSLIHI